MIKIKPERKTKTDIYQIVILHTASEELTKKFALSQLKDIKNSPLPQGIKKIEQRYWHMKGTVRPGSITPSYLHFTIDNTIYSPVKLMAVVKNFVIKDLKVDNLPEGIAKVREEWLWQNIKIPSSNPVTEKVESVVVPADIMPEPEYGCEFCSKTCSSATGLTLHLKNCKKKPS